MGWMRQKLSTNLCVHITTAAAVAPDDGVQMKRKKQVCEASRYLANKCRLSCDIIVHSTATHKHTHCVFQLDKKKEEKLHAQTNWMEWSLTLFSKNLMSDTTNEDQREYRHITWWHIELSAFAAMSGIQWPLAFLYTFLHCRSLPFGNANIHKIRFLHTKWSFHFSIIATQDTLSTLG